MSHFNQILCPTVLYRPLLTFPFAVIIFLPLGLANQMQCELDFLD